MDVSDYIRVLRVRWIVIALTLTVAGMAAAIYSFVATPMYEACARLYVSTGSSQSSVTEVYQGNLASQQRVASYTELLDGESVAQRTIDALNLALTPQQLADKVSTTSSPDTVLIDTCVTDSSPVTARDLANGIGSTFVGFVDDLETPPGGGAALAKVSVVEPAQTPTEAVSPMTVRNIGLGLAVGLLVGIALAVIRDRLDNTIKDRTALASSTGLPVVGVVPYDKSIATSATLSFAESSSGAAEAFREMRTNLQFFDVDSPPRVLVVTSAVPAEGKTTTAVNLALVLAEAGHRVALVEGDLRRPRVSRYMDLTGAVGLSTVLSAQAEIHEVMQPTRFPGVEVLASGPLPPNPSELLGSEAARFAVGALRVEFDYVVIDAPPLLPVTDASVIAAHADGVIVVTRHGHTTRDEMTRALGNLTRVGARVLGAVLTMTPSRGGRGDDYRHYYETDPTVPHQDSGTQPVRPPTVAATAPIPVVLTDDDELPTEKRSGRRRADRQVAAEPPPRAEEIPRAVEASRAEGATDAPAVGRDQDGPLRDSRRAKPDRRTPSVEPTRVKAGRVVRERRPPPQSGTRQVDSPTTESTISTPPRRTRT